MSTTTMNDAPEAAAAAMTEAARIAAQAARRGTETARESIEVARSYFDETSDLGKGLYSTWVSQSEATLKAAFAAQDAAIEAGLSLFDVGVKSNCAEAAAANRTRETVASRVFIVPPRLSDSIPTDIERSATWRPRVLSPGGTISAS